MTSEEKPAPDVQMLAHQATLLTENRAFKEAMSAVRGTYTKAMIETEPDDAKTRDHFHRCIHALNDVESALTAFINTGKIDLAMKVKQERAKK